MEINALLRNLLTKRIMKHLHEIKVVVLIYRCFASSGGGRRRSGALTVGGIVGGSLPHEVVVHVLGARLARLLVLVVGRRDEFFENVVHDVTGSYLQWW